MSPTPWNNPSRPSATPYTVRPAIWTFTAYNWDNSPDNWATAVWDWDSYWTITWWTPWTSPR